MNHIRLFDCHCDTISRIYDQGGTLQKNDYHISLEKAQCFSRYAQIFAIWGDSSTDQNIEGRFRAQMELAHTLLDGKNGAPMLCRNAKEIKRAYASGHNAAFLSAEGAELLGCSEKTLEQAYNDGLRFLVLTWNNRNLCACSAAADESEGLTLHGRNFVKTADEIGIILDVSHLSQRGFFEIDEIVKRPFIASHSNSRAVYE
ncbi:MAG: membrane dipeptidase, partial [Clostridiales bacterium]|nr:membrane dipeptidase [Clostridiales bacterium]